MVIGDLIVDIGAVESAAVKLGETLQSRIGLLAERRAGGIRLRRHMELLDQRQRLAIHRLVIAYHLGCEAANLRVVRLGKRLLGRAMSMLPAV
jgi:hypothetical protein